MIYVDDDSPDGTAATVRELAQRDSRVRCIQRIGRRGLSTACIEGMLASSAPIVAVIDADLQHDERLLPAMFDALRGDDLDVVVGSRYAEGGSMEGWDRTRVATSRFATRLSRLVLKADLQDTMSGFFMIRRAAVERCVRAGMSGVGFRSCWICSPPRPSRSAVANCPTSSATAFPARANSIRWWRGSSS